MGISSRDYYRDERPNLPLFAPGEPNAVKALLIINVIVFFAQAMTIRMGEIGFSPVTQWAQLELSLVAHGEVWRLITCGFTHGGIWHIIFNMWVLWLFGTSLESRIGSREFLAVYLIGILLSSAGHLLFQGISGQTVAAVGASGGVMTVIFATAIHEPRRQVLMFFVIPCELRVLAVVCVLLDLIGLANPASHVANAAHLAGAAWGAAYVWYRLDVTGWWNNPHRAARRKEKKLASKAKKQKLGIFNPDDDAELQRSVDEILDKMNEHGEESLTEKERKILQQASKHFKDKKGS